jgi:pimeloyl-ACP methyl ester carboxylesterase
MKLRLAKILFAVLGIGLVAGMGGCGSNAAVRSSHTAEAPGTLVEVKPIADIDPVIRDLGAESLRVLYRSTSSDDKHTVVSGSLYVPAGTPPPGGWIVFALAHGTTGINNECGPSLSPNLFGMASIVASYLKAGYAVAFADYQGLGAPGIHVYLDSKTEAYNVIDSVRALRNAKRGAISDRWVVFGGSQGGGGSWATAEQAPVYAPELHLAGAVNAVPAAEISGYARMAEAESMTLVQTAAYTAILITQSRAHPDLDMDLYRRGSVTKNWDSLAQCYGPRLEERNNAVKAIKPDEVKPATHEATLKLESLLKAMAVPQRKTDVPMLVIYAGKDEYIDAAWTRKAIEEACRMGTKIEVDFQADKSHGTFDGSRLLGWMHDRLEGKPLAKSCEW